jgi:hypothetical protein
MPSRQGAVNKIQNSLGQRAETDRHISTAWPGILAVLQVLWIITLIAGLYLIFIDLEPFFYEPDVSFEFSTEALLVVLLAFLVQLCLTVTQAYLAYRIVLRRDEHFRRDWLLREGAIELLGAKSVEKEADLNVERWTMNTIHQDANIMERERAAVMWGVIVGLLSFIPVVGYALLAYVLHFVTKEQRIHEDRQLAFNYQFQTGLSRTGTQPVPVNWQAMPRRSTALYMILTLLTLTFFLPYWWYVVITDFNAHLENQRRFEDQLMVSIRQDG